MILVKEDCTSIDLIIYAIDYDGSVKTDVINGTVDVFTMVSGIKNYILSGQTLNANINEFYYDWNSPGLSPGNYFAQYTLTDANAISASFVENIVVEQELILSEIEASTILAKTADVTSAESNIRGGVETLHSLAITLSGLGVDISDLPTASETADAVWDEVLTGATHNVATSAGRRLRQIAGSVVLDGAVVSSTGNTITFDGDASTLDGAYDPSCIYIVDGPGAGQCRNILQYSGSTKTAVVDRNWRVNPTSSSTYVIVGDAGREHVNEGLARGGTQFTITLNTNASDNDGEYVGQVLFIRSGTGEDQARRVISYDGTTKVVTTRKAWSTIPDTTSAYVMLPTAELDIDKIYTGVADAVWNESKDGHTGDLKVIADNVDVAVSTRLEGSVYVAPDNTNINNIWGEIQTLPTLSGIEASVVLAKTADITVAESNIRGGSETLETLSSSIDQINIGDNDVIEMISGIESRVDTLPLLTDIEASTVLAKEATIASAVSIGQTILKYSSNKIVVNDNKLTVYDDDGTTPIKVFNLLNSSNVPATFNVTQRVPV